MPKIYHFDVFWITFLFSNLTNFKNFFKNQNYSHIGLDGSIYLKLKKKKKKKIKLSLSYEIFNQKKNTFPQQWNKLSKLDVQCFC